MHTSTQTAGRAPRSFALLAAFVAGAVLGALATVALSAGEDTPVDGTTTTVAGVVAFAEEPATTWTVTREVPVTAEPHRSSVVVAQLSAADGPIESTGRVAITDGLLWREVEVPGVEPGWVPADSVVAYEDARGLPAEAVDTAEALARAARAGDLDGLAALALDGGMPFTATFGREVTTPEDLVALWESIGRQEVLDAIVGLVALPDWYETAAQAPDGDAVAIFVTPRFMHQPESAENRRLLEEALGADYVERSMADGQYLGWRLGITADGDWRFFVAGD